jgi:predicted HicB family RNase H-like nuclease
MPIAKRPQNTSKAQPTDEAAANAFIEGAGKPAAIDTSPRRKRKERVMIQFDEKVLDRVDTAAERRGISRSAWIQYVVSRALDQGEG